MDRTPDGKAIERSIERDGICVLQNAVAEPELASLGEEIEALAAMSVPWLHRHPTANGYFLSFSPLVARKLGEDARIRRLTAVFGQPALTHLCRRTLGPLWFVDRVALDRSEPSSEPITDWHADQFEARGECIKFMLYLTDTDAGNGAFSYVPGSHRLIRELVRRHPSDNRELHLIEDIRAKAEAVMAAAPKAAPKVRALMDDMVGHIASARASDDHYSVAAPAGSIVAFNANGIHRGGVARERHRLVARSHCRNFRLAKALNSVPNAVTTAERMYYRITSPAAARGLL
jgi:hypothetical protein